MDTSTQLLRRAGQNSVKIIVSIVLTALLTTTLAVPALMHAGTTGYAHRGGSWMADIRGLVRDPLAYLSQRSPGARDSRNLHQLKHRAVKLARHGVKPPHEQVLANVRYPSRVPDYLNDILPPVRTGLFEPGPVSLFNGPGTSGGPGIPPPVVPVGTGPGGGSGGGTPPIGVVPEPATWLTLLFGMTMVGAGLRSRQRQLAERAPSIGFRARV